jgi:hypothetical protein
VYLTPLRIVEAIIGSGTVLSIVRSSTLSIAADMHYLLVERDDSGVRGWK